MITMNQSDHKIQKILVVEDDFNIRFITSEFLKTLDFDVVSAENGREGYEHLLKQNFDLVITDVMMPLMTGTELLKNIRRLKGENFPVIVVSGSDFNEVLEGNFTKMLRKPYPFERLLANIHSLDMAMA